MTNEDLYNVRAGIAKSAEIVNVANIDFAFTMARINSEVTNEIKIIEEARKKPPEEESKKYSKELEAINLEHSVQKEDGTIQTINNNTVIRNLKEYKIKLDDFEIKYKDLLETVKKNNEEFKELLKQEVKVTITKLPKKCIPAIMNVEQMTLLFTVIE